MKKLIFLAISLLSLQANGQIISSFAMWLSGGYNNFIYDRPEEYTNLGFAGGNIGLGYDLQAGSFLFQIGGEFQHYTSNTTLRDFRETIPMLNTEGTPYNGIFDFNRNREHQRMGNIGGVLNVGFISESNFYMLFGIKYAFNMYGNLSTYTTVTSLAEYERIIGDNDEGILQNMPNHGYYKERRTLSRDIKFDPILFGAMEAGIQFNGYYFLGAVPRLALAVDWGITARNDNNQSNIRFMDISSTEEFRPALSPFNYNLDSKVMPMFFGVKFTLLWQGDRTSYCNCIQDFKWKLTKGRKGKAAKGKFK